MISMTRHPVRHRRWGLLLSLALSACHSPLLPATTLQRAAPRCGEHPIAPRLAGGEITYFPCQVDTDARSVTELTVRFPALLAQANIDGMVEMQFVVDGRGRVDPTTVVVLQSAHALF